MNLNRCPLFALEGLSDSTEPTPRTLPDSKRTGPAALLRSHVCFTVTITRFSEDQPGGARCLKQHLSRAQGPEADLPPGTSAVDCDGTEASLLDCLSSAPFGIQQECSRPGSANDATVLACGTSSAGVPHSRVNSPLSYVYAACGILAPGCMSIQHSICVYRVGRVCMVGLTTQACMQNH